MVFRFYFAYERMTQSFDYIETSRKGGPHENHSSASSSRIYDSVGYILFGYSPDLISNPLMIECWWGFITAQHGPVLKST